MPTPPRDRPYSNVRLVSDEAAEPLVPEEQPETEEQKTARASKAKREALLKDARDRWTLVSEAESEQRARELDDLKFARANTEDQWPEQVVRERAGGLVNGKMVPARPCLTVDKLGQPIEQVVAEVRNSRLGIVVKPKGEKSSPLHAELRTGLIRAIEVDSNAPVVRTDAVRRAIQCGRGFYRIRTDYADDLDYDQDILIEAILDQSCVYLDPMAKKPDYSDMEWAFITTDMTPTEYKRRFHRKPPGREGDEVASGSDFTSTTDVPPAWLAEDVVRVAEYFHVEHVTCDLVLDRQTGEKHWAQPWPTEHGDPPRKWTTLPVWREDVQGPIPDDPERIVRRKVDVRKVKWALITWGEVLEEAEWPSQYIPIIAVTGKQYVVEGKRVLKGLISNSKDAQRANNYMISAMMERVGLGSKAPYLLDPRQIEDYEEAWRISNTANLPYLPYDASVVRPDGSPLPPPTRNLAEPDIQAITVALGFADAAIKATTGRFDPSLGNLSGNERSGKAIRELKQQGEQSTSIYLDNLATISMAYEGRILLDLMPSIYDRQGRLLRLLGEEPDDERWALVKTPYTTGPDGRPVPVAATPPQGRALPPGVLTMGPRPVAPQGPPQAPPMAGGPMPPSPMAGPMDRAAAMPPPGMPPGMPSPAGPSAAPAPPPEPPITLDLGEGDYSVQVSVGKSFLTQREQNLDLLTAMVEATKGAIAPQIIDLWAEMLDGPMGRKLAKRFRSQNPNLERGAGQLPPEIQGQMQQMQQALQEAQAQLQAAQQELKAGTAKAEIDAATKRAELESKERIEGMRIQQQFDLERFKAAEARALQDDQQAHQVALEQMKLKIGSVEAALAHERSLAAAEASDDRQFAASEAADARQADFDREAFAREAAQMPPAPPEPEPPAPDPEPYV